MRRFLHGEDSSEAFWQGIRRPSLRRRNLYAVLDAVLTILGAPAGRNNGREHDLGKFGSVRSVSLLLTISVFVGAQFS